MLNLDLKGFYTEGGIFIKIKIFFRYAISLRSRMFIFAALKNNL